MYLTHVLRKAFHTMREHQKELPSYQRHCYYLLKALQLESQKSMNISQCSQNSSLNMCFSLKKKSLQVHQAKFTYINSIFRYNKPKDNLSLSIFEIRNHSRVNEAWVFFTAHSCIHRHTWASMLPASGRLANSTWIWSWDMNSDSYENNRGHWSKWFCFLPSCIMVASLFRCSG